MVAQVRRRREAAERCEPLDCGHQDPIDCEAAGSDTTGAQNYAPDAQPVTEPDPDVLTELWANAKVAWCARDFPKYGSPEWIALGPEDPRRLAGALEAAEMWRKYGDEDELCEWLKRLGRQPNLVDTRSRAQLDTLAKPKPPHQLEATPGWPPIRVPGGNGRYLKHTEGRAAA
ncbi:hypothetical protein ACH4UY_33415 [Streptomyces longwoodensis]|uniref:hypothetical protein n=1 Tax=Streptomyces longwoodensis TaxID=68231 RepID=UPI0037A68A2C